MLVMRGRLVCMRVCECRSMSVAGIHHTGDIVGIMRSSSLIVVGCPHILHTRLRTTLAPTRTHRHIDRDLVLARPLASCSAFNLLVRKQTENAGLATPPPLHCHHNGSATPTSGFACVCGLLLFQARVAQDCEIALLFLLLSSLPARA